MVGTPLKTYAAPTAQDIYNGIKEHYVSDLDLLNHLMISQVQSEIPLIKDIAHHILQAGGKRMRPLSLFMASRIFNYSGKDHIHLAASLEFIHTATLLHDDVIDESATRRGRPTANQIWDNKASILMGDFLFSQSFKLMMACENLEILKVLSSVTAIITRGELKQLSCLGGIHLSEHDYYDIVSSKTGALFSAATEVGALLGGASKEHQVLMKEIGLALGKIFQVLDDLLDYGLTTTNIGKDFGDDFFEGKITLPVLLSYKKGTHKEKDFWESVFSKKHRAPEDFEAAQKILKTQIIDLTILDEACKIREEAEKKLMALPDSPVKSHFLDLFQFSVTRKV